jgi:hypothetical protein
MFKLLACLTGAVLTVAAFANGAHVHGYILAGLTALLVLVLPSGGEDEPEYGRR